MADKILDSFIVLPAKKEKCLIAQRFIGKQGDAWRQKCHILARTEYFKLKPVFLDEPAGILADTAYLIASYQVMMAIKSSMDDVISLEDIDRISLKSAKKKKKSPQMEWLKDHSSAVTSMLSEGWSSHEMESFFLENQRYKHKVSHTTILKYIKEVVNEQVNEQA